MDDAGLSTQLYEAMSSQLVIVAHSVDFLGSLDSSLAEIRCKSDPTGGATVVSSGFVKPTVERQLPRECTPRPARAPLWPLVLPL